MKTMARKRPMTHRAMVSCWKGSRGRNGERPSIIATVVREETTEIEGHEHNKTKRLHEGLYEKRSESSFRLRFVTTLAHMILDNHQMRKASSSPSVEHNSQWNSPHVTKI